MSLETYSVLTRLPAGLAVSGDNAADVLAQRFEDTPLRLPARARQDLLGTLAEAGVTGGSVYDGLVALEAASAGRTLLSLDVRARRTYERLGVSFEMIET